MTGLALPGLDLLWSHFEYDSTSVEYFLLILLSAGCSFFFQSCPDPINLSMSTLYFFGKTGRGKEENFTGRGCKHMS